MDANSEARLSELHPILSSKMHTVATMLAVKWVDGTELRITQGGRTWANQHALYLQGRADLADVNACRLNCGLAPIPADMNKRVTDADAGESWHNLFCACDVAPFRDGFPVWDTKDPAWDDIMAAGESVGLRSGKSWGDEPHFQYTGRFPYQAPDDEARELWKQGRDVLWAQIT